MNQKPKKPEAEAKGSGARPVALQIAHLTRGRIRFRLGESLSRDALTALITRISEIPDVARVVARPNTRSIILDITADGEPVIERLKADGVAVIMPHVPMPPLAQLAQFSMTRMDATIGKRTDGMLDTRTVLATILILIAIAQLSRGKIAGPATTLLMSAFSLLDRTDRS